MEEIGTHTSTEREAMVTLHLRDARAQVLPDGNGSMRYSDCLMVIGYGVVRPNRKSFQRDKSHNP